MFSLSSGFHMRMESNSYYFHFAFLGLAIGLENSRHFLIQLEVELKPIVTGILSKVFPRFSLLHVFASNFDCFTGLSLFL